jgi:tetratricopeptide (TPR) repeat protein
MKRTLLSTALAVLLCSVALHGQMGKIGEFPAGSPEDKALQAATAEQDAQKRVAMYEDFVQKFSSNPGAVAYGNWQIAQYYQAAGDSQKALDYGDKALASASNNLGLIVFQANVAQSAKNYPKVMQYAVQGGTAYNAAKKDAKPAAAGSESSGNDEEDAAADKSSYTFLEAAAFNALANENDPTARMDDIDRFNSAFPNSQFADQIATYAMMSLTQLNDRPRLVAYGEKTLATDPNNLSALLLLANAYVDDPKPGSLAKAVTYAQRAIAAAKADAPGVDKAHKVSAGAAHSTLGYAYMKQDKTAAAIPELRAATVLLRDQSDQDAIALYRLGFAYAKLRRVDEARQALMQAVNIPGPVQKPAQDLLLKVNAARAQAR